MKNLWNTLVNWLENGDIIPPLIAVSVFHYIYVLAEYEWWPIAAIISFLTDLGHYRTIKSYLKKKGWLWMVILTVISFGFHVAFYALGGAGGWAWPLGLVVPVLIFALSNLSHSERWGTKVKRNVAETSRQDTADKYGKETVRDWRLLSPEQKRQIAGMTTRRTRG